MGLTPQMLKYLIRLKQKHGLEGPLCTIGVQDIYATETDVEKWLDSEGIPYQRPSSLRRTTSRGLPQIGPGNVRCLHAASFFEYLGVSDSDYFDLDKFPSDSPRIIHDLQRPVPPELRERFTFVLDSGTLEHIFDVPQTLRNYVDMLRPGGQLLLVLPANQFLNHGFYQFSPTLFHDFATANGLSVVEAHIIEIRPRVHRFWEYRQDEDYLGMFFAAGRRLVNCFLLRKEKDHGCVKNAPCSCGGKGLPPSRQGFRITEPVRGSGGTQSFTPAVALRAKEDASEAQDEDLDAAVEKDVAESSAPTQYLYAKLATDEQRVVADFVSQTALDRMTSRVRRWLPTSWHGLFFAPWSLLKRLQFRRPYFDIRP